VLTLATLSKFPTHKALVHHEHYSILIKNAVTVEITLVPLGWSLVYASAEADSDSGTTVSTAVILRPSFDSAINTTGSTSTFPHSHRGDIRRSLWHATHLKMISILKY
jgi:hypothetical protein